MKTLPKRWNCFRSPVGENRQRLVAMSVGGGFSPTHLKKYAQVKLDHATPIIGMKIKHRNILKPPPKWLHQVVQRSTSSGIKKDPCEAPSRKRSQSSTLVSAGREKDMWSWPWREGPNFQKTPMGLGYCTIFIFYGNKTIDYPPWN